MWYRSLQTDKWKQSVIDADKYTALEAEPIETKCFGQAQCKDVFQEKHESLGKSSHWVAVNRSQNPLQYSKSN